MKNLGFLKPISTALKIK